LHFEVVGQGILPASLASLLGEEPPPFGHFAHHKSGCGFSLVRLLRGIVCKVMEVRELGEIVIGLA
jgi:hypothetical protein